MTDPTDYKTHISGTFTRASATYDQIGPSFFSYFGRKLVEFGAPAVGSRVLDIACGKGAVLFPAAESVSYAGEVIGIDLSEGMIKELQKEIRKRGVDNAESRVMDAEKLEFANSSFDYVFCGLCLFFFPDLRQALREVHRVLRPGGLIIASTFDKLPATAFDSEFRGLVETFKDRVRSAPEAETLRLDTRGEIRMEMNEAGFTDVDFRARRKTFYFQDAAEWWRSAWSHGQRAFLDRIHPEALPEFEHRAIEIAEKVNTERGIQFRCDLLFTRARKPLGLTSARRTSDK